MGAFAILLGFGLMAALGGLMSGSDNGDDTSEAGDTMQEPGETPTDDVSPDLDNDDPDTGATLTIRSDGTVDIELGEDEPGTLAAFVYQDAIDTPDPNNPTIVYEARFYLVPEDVDLPMNSNEERVQIPGKEPGHIGEFSLSDMEAALGLELLGTVDLGADNLGYDVFDPNGLRSELPPVTANAPLEIFRGLAQTERDDIFAFLGEYAPPTYKGASRIVATGDTDVTDETDWIFLPQTAQSGTLNGAGGDDYLITGADGSDLIGGAGDDKLSALADATTIAGGAGNDDIRASGSGVVNGGAGNDDIFASGGDVSASGGYYGMPLENITITDAPLVLNGGDGDDTIRADYVTAEANGGAGNDLLSLIDGATGYGQAGNDTIRIERDGGIAYGGAGDEVMQVSRSGIADGGEGADTITAYLGWSAETLSLSGGAGVDTFQVATSDYNPTPNNVYQSVTITDFDPIQEVIENLGYE